MKKLALLIFSTLISFNAAARSAEQVLPIFQYYSANAESGGALTIQLMSNGTIHARNLQWGGDEEGNKVIFDGDIARVDAATLLNFQRALESVKPGMQLRDPSRKEQEDFESCSNDGGFSYSVLGPQFADGALLVRKSYGCESVLDLRHTWKGMRANRAVKPIIDAIEKALRDSADEIFKNVK